MTYQSFLKKQGIVLHQIISNEMIISDQKCRFRSFYLKIRSMKKDFSVFLFLMNITGLYRQATFTDKRNRNVYPTLKKRGRNILFFLIILMILTAGCAAQHKYKKYKPIPCPCEKENKK